MKKYHLSLDKDGSVSIDEMEVEIVQRALYEYKTKDEHAYKILDGKHQGETWYWWALCDKEQVTEKANLMQDKHIEKLLMRFLTFIDLIKTDKLSERYKWR